MNNTVRKVTREAIYYCDRHLSYNHLNRDNGPARITIIGQEVWYIRNKINRKGDNPYAILRDGEAEFDSKRKMQ